MANFHITRHPRTLNTPNTLWRAWDSFAQDFDSFFDDFDRSLGSNILPRDNRGQTFSPMADVQESDKAYELSFDMPGFKPEEMTIDLNGNTLTVSGQRERSSNDSKLHRSEKFYGEYRRSISLPENIKGDQIEASYENGVLNIQVPKSQLAQSRKIEIGSSAGKKTLSNGSPATDTKKRVEQPQNANKARDMEQQQNLSH